MTDRSRTVTVAQMQAIDAAAIEALAIPRLLLMEHAGLSLARVVQQYCPSFQTPILVVAGKGFNGGDGLCAARHLHQWGYPLRVLLTESYDRLRTEPKIYATMLKRLKVAWLECLALPLTDEVIAWIEQASVIVDALLGVGVSGVLREPARTLIEQINARQCCVVAADVPSGLNADSGEPCGVAVKATHTVTFGLTKQGCVQPQARAYVGTLSVDTIGFPPELLQR